MRLITNSDSFFFSSRRRNTRYIGDWSSDVCSSDLSMKNFRFATSSEITNLKFFMEHLRLGRWFDVAKIIYDDGSRPGKPAPDVYLAAARNIGVDRKSVV